MDVSGELAKRISRRQFLFGGRNSGGGGSETGVLGTVLGAAGVGIGVMALGSPGPSAQSFQDAYVQKNPTASQILQSLDAIIGLRIRTETDATPANAPFQVTNRNNTQGLRLFFNQLIAFGPDPFGTAGLVSIRKGATELQAFGFDDGSGENIFFLGDPSGATPVDMSLNELRNAIIDQTCGPQTSGAQITATALGVAGTLADGYPGPNHRHGVSLAAVANIANVGDGLEAAGTSTTVPRGDHKHQFAFNSSSADPTTTNITAGNAMLWKNTTSGELRLWANDGGTLKSVLLA